MLDAVDGVRPRVLIVDDDDDIARYVELNLSLEGFDNVVARDGRDAMEQAVLFRPDVVLLDVMMPGIDGFEVCRRLRADARTSRAAILMLTAKTMTADTVMGLTSGADDYISKPFDPPELVARVRAAIRRAQQLRDVSPLTGLPGNSEISRQIQSLVDHGESFALAHIDLDRFKAYNDRYGFTRGDDAIRRTAQLLLEVITEGGGRRFLGHIGGDDFVAVTAPDEIADVAAEIIRRFDEMAPSLYDPDDAERGSVLVDDRRRERHAFGLMTISLGIVTTDRRRFETVGEVTAVATEMKRTAKHDEHSSYRIDRRG